MIALTSRFAIFAMAVSPAWAQCSMCRTAAESLPPQQAAALNAGIAVLLAAPLFLFGLFGWLLYSRRQG